MDISLKSTSYLELGFRLEEAEEEEPEVPSELMLELSEESSLRIRLLERASIETIISESLLSELTEASSESEE